MLYDTLVIARLISNWELKIPKYLGVYSHQLETYPEPENEHDEFIDSFSENSLKYMKYILLYEWMIRSLIN